MLFHVAAIGKARKGGFAALNVEELVTPLFKATLERTGVLAHKIEDIVVGSQLFYVIVPYTRLNRAQWLEMNLKNTL